MKLKAIKRKFGTTFLRNLKARVRHTVFMQDMEAVKELARAWSKYTMYSADAAEDLWLDIAGRTDFVSAKRLLERFLESFEKEVGICRK